MGKGIMFMMKVSILTMILASSIKMKAMANVITIIFQIKQFKISWEITSNPAVTSMATLFLINVRPIHNHLKRQLVENQDKINQN